MEEMINFIDKQKEEIGVEPICKILPIAPSSFYARKAIAKNPDLTSNRAKQHVIDCKEIRRIFDKTTKFMVHVRSGNVYVVRAKILRDVR